MSTYAQLQSRISDDLNRTDLTTQIQQQILLAITNYKNERMAFNETSATLTAVVGQAYITAPTDLLEIDDLYLTISSRNIPMVQRSLDDVIRFRPASNGRPLWFAYYQDRFEFARPFDTAYSLPLYYLKALTVLSSGSDTNGWTTDGEDLIVWRAEKILYGTVIKDTDKANLCAQLETTALTQLRDRRNKKTMTGYTVGHYL